MECEERDRLLESYFEALDQKRRIDSRLQEITESGAPEDIAVARRLSEAAIDDCYDAWHDLNTHQDDHSCGS